VPLLARTISTPLVIEVRAGAVAALAPLLSDGRISTGGKVALVVGPGRGDRLAKELMTALPAASVVPIAGANMESAQQVIAHLREDYHDAVIGVGGGQTLDTAKYAASMVGLPFVAVATTLTNDGLASPVATLESYGRKASFGVHQPIAVFVDIDHVRDAPDEHTRSGVGDVLSNLSAIRDWELARDVTGEHVDGLAVALARTAAEALLAVAPGTDHFLTVLAEGLITSGIAMAVAGSSRPCSGGCHEISHALDASFASPGLHGAQVAFGARFATWRRGEEELLATLDRAMLVHRLPRAPEELGLTREDFGQVLLEAPTTRPDRFTILEHDPVTPDNVKEVVDAYVQTIDR
jgi:glycerol-1-phosphate dehydrogenase [NAD(P)+]